jgi:hypothetical protein
MPSTIQYEIEGNQEEEEIRDQRKRKRYTKMYARCGLYIYIDRYIYR